jgi:predicted RNA-binding protein with PIN domain
VALILDGYNLIGALDRYRVAVTLDAARDLLINDALKAAGWTGRPLIVVFDAHRGPEPRGVCGRRDRTPALQTGGLSHGLHG